MPDKKILFKDGTWCYFIEEQISDTYFKAKAYPQSSNLHLINFFYKQNIRLPLKFDKINNTHYVDFQIEIDKIEILSNTPGLLFIFCFEDLNHKLIGNDFIKEWKSKRDLLEDLRDEKQQEYAIAQQQLDMAYSNLKDHHLKNVVESFKTALQLRDYETEGEEK